MKKGLMLLATAAAVFFIAACSTVRPVAGAIMQAAQNGGITKVGTVDLKIDYPASPAIPYYIVTTVVTGE